MNRTKFSQTYIALLDLLFKTKGSKHSLYSIQQEGARFSRVETPQETMTYRQSFFMSAAELWTMCTPAEWYLVGRISAELKEYNALWYCDPKLKNSSNNRKAIKGLVDKKVLFLTETTHIYLVNPVYIRRGDVFGVLNTTAQLLCNAPKVELEHVVHKKAVKEFDASLDQHLIPTNISEPKDPSSE